ncbi:hypothetical protein [Candidatus Poseidonia alphae]|uniref:hypothetical protein n=1 Tax=Candidatus Poseidonia alphae TaxID=1915863 RepID=UPI0030C6E355
MLNKPYLNTDSAAAMLIADAPEEEAMGGPTTIAPGNVAIGSMTIGAEFTAIGAEEAIGSGVGSGGGLRLLPPPCDPVLLTLRRD